MYATDFLVRTGLSVWLISMGKPVDLEQLAAHAAIENKDKI